MDFSNIEMATVFPMLTQQLTGYIWLGNVFAVKVNRLQSAQYNFFFAQYNFFSLNITFNLVFLFNVS